MPILGETDQDKQLECFEIICIEALDYQELRGSYNVVSKREWSYSP